MKFSSLIAVTAAAIFTPALSNPIATPVSAAIAEPELNGVTPNTNHLQRRGWDGEPTCFKVEGREAWQNALYRAYVKLNSEPPSRTIVGPPGPRACIVASCVDGGGIELCNDRREAVYVRATDIADAGLKIINSCRKIDLKGQWFNTDGWNVVVRGC
ncbi:hypothetical protein ABW19_dt0206012 [Dactylella cylindrospora]|nr:hypothetical protein ABW19_dt0206012 [Dactylella cylindrospora]